MGLLDVYAAQADTGAPTPLTTVPRSLGERVEATAAETFAPDRYFNIRGARREMWQRAVDELHAATGATFANPYGAMSAEEMSRLGNQPAVEAERSQKIIEASRMARAQGNDDLFDPENIDRYIGEESQRRRDTAARNVGTGNGVLNFLAGAAMASVEPINVLALGLPVSRLPTAASSIVGETFLRNVAREAALQAGANVVLQGATEGLDYTSRRETGTEQTAGEIATNMAAAGVFGGLIGGGVRALHLKWLGLPEKVREAAPLEVKDAFRVIEAESIYQGQNRLGVDPLLHERYQGRAMDAVMRGMPVDLADLSRTADTPLTALGTILRSQPDQIRVEGVGTALDRVRSLPDSEISAVLRETRPDLFRATDRIEARAAELDAREAALRGEQEQIGLADIVDVDTGARLQQIERDLERKNISNTRKADLEREREMIVSSIDREGKLPEELAAVRRDFFPEQQKAMGEITQAREALGRERDAAQSVLQREVEQVRKRLEALQVGGRFADEAAPDVLAREFGGAPADLAEAIARADVMRQARLVREGIGQETPTGQRSTAPTASKTATSESVSPEAQKAIDTEVRRIVETPGALGRFKEAVAKQMEEIDQMVKDARAATGCAMGGGAL